MSRIQTFTGRLFDLANPAVAQVNVRDIAHALSNLCRFGGHSQRFYSVAEHSVLVSHVVPREFAREGLMHDAEEAYIIDVPRPLKVLLGTAYSDISRDVSLAIAERYRLRFPWASVIHTADNQVLMAEREQIMANQIGEWPDYEPAKVNVIGLPPQQAEDLFLKRFAFLFGRSTE